ncbi:hypothetical protein [Caenispirillum bisanense]|uniref:hypothetical protein n=1 Tax=Caenispirillum bisanense TaxID=414052 RepID=UPI0011414A8A|nr:hypothetical protein [Caenispirillum bisanense]
MIKSTTIMEHKKPKITKLDHAVSWITLLSVLTIWGLIITLPIYFLNQKKIGKRWISDIESEANKKFIEFVGQNPKYVDIFITDAGDKYMSASALAYRDGRLFVMENGLAAEIPWAAVRSWSYEVVEAGKMVTTSNNLFDKMDVGKINRRMQDEADKKSGLKIFVADVDKPVWFLMTSDEGILTKWHEIFNQINEGTLMIAPYSNEPIPA